MLSIVISLSCAGSYIDEQYMKICKFINFDASYKHVYEFSYTLTCTGNMDYTLFTIGLCFCWDLLCLLSGEDTKCRLMFSVFIIIYVMLIICISLGVSVSVLMCWCTLTDRSILQCPIVNCQHRKFMTTSFLHSLIL